MEKTFTDPKTGLQYELVGDYYLIAGEDVPPTKPIGIWGQRHLEYIRNHKRGLYIELLTTGKLNEHLAGIDEAAGNMFSRLVAQLSRQEGLTESLKAGNPMLWVQRMNNVRHTASEIVTGELIYC